MAEQKVTSKNLKDEIYDEYLNVLEQLNEAEGQEADPAEERYAKIGRLAERYIQRERTAKFTSEMDEARALKAQIAALIEG